MDKDANFNPQGGYYGNALQAACYRGYSFEVVKLYEAWQDSKALLRHKTCAEQKSNQKEMLPPESSTSHTTKFDFAQRSMNSKNRSSCKSGGAVIEERAVLH